MKRILVCIGYFFLLSHSIFCQFAIPEWSSRTGSLGWDIVNDMVVDSSGNVYLTGCTTDTLMERKSSSVRTNTTRYFFVEKFDTSGKKLWHKDVIQAGIGYGCLMKIHDNQIIIAGGNILGNSEKRESIKKYSFFIGCIDIKGETKWLQTFQGTKLDYLTSLTINENTQQIILTGYFIDTVSMNQSKFSSQGKSDALIIYLDKSGRVKKVCQLSGNGDDRILAVTVAENANICVIGMYDKSINLGNGITLSKDQPKVQNIFYAVFNEQGKCIEGKNIGSGKGVKITSFIKDNHHYYLSGSFSESLRIGDQTCVSSGNDDAFICCTGKDMKVKWFRHLQSNKKDRAGKMILKDNELILSGSYSSKLSIGQVEIPFAGSGCKAFMASFDTAGVLKWTRTFVSSSSYFPKSFTSDTRGKLYLTGSFRDSLSITEQKIASTGEEDIFIAKLNNCSELPPVHKEPVILCEGEHISLDAGSDFAEYDWNNGMSFDQILEVDQGGDNSIKLIAENGCILYDTITVKEYDKPDFSLGNDTTINDTSYLVLRVPETFASYSWSNGIEEPINLIKGYELNEGLNRFSLTVSNENGCIEVDDINIFMVRTSKVKYSSQLDKACFIYPNPTDGLLTITFTVPLSELKIEFFNSLGSEVSQKEFKEYQSNYPISTDLSYFPKGFYTIKITTDHEFISRKIILQ